MYTIISPFSLRPTKIMEQANKLIQRAQELYEENKDIMKPKDREVAKDKMSEFSSNFYRSAKGLRHDVQEMFWLAQTEEAKRYFSHAQEVFRIVKRIVDEEAI
ncbi:hypothetical protein V8E53_004900 [Lactarius tabidus]